MKIKHELFRYTQQRIQIPIPLSDISMNEHECGMCEPSYGSSHLILFECINSNGKRFTMFCDNCVLAGRENQEEGEKESRPEIKRQKPKAKNLVSLII